MKLKIIGWTDYDSHFPSITIANEEVNELLLIIIKEITAHGYMLSGEAHQNAVTGVPVFNDGTCFRGSMRAWSVIMSTAYPEIDGKETNYMDFYMSTPKPTKLPEQTQIDIEPLKANNFGGFIISQDREILSQSLQAGLPFLTTDKTLNNIMDEIKKKKDSQLDE